MKNSNSTYVEVGQLRIGMFIDLDVGWMSHPFPSGSFKITSDKQIEVIAGLGLTRVLHLVEKSDLTTDAANTPGASADPSAIPGAAPSIFPKPTQYERDMRAQHAGLLVAQQRRLVLCERRFGEALRQYRKTVEQVHSNPRVAADQCRAMVAGYVQEMFEGESAIRLLTETSGEKSSMHPVNVTVLALLLGKTLGLGRIDLVDLGMAAFLHDIGKVQLPDRVRWFDDSFSLAETKAYQEHVWQSVQTARSMDVSEPAVMAISQHHEMVDGSGFPLRIHGAQLTVMGKILALVNRYDNLCNPTRPAAAVTPHEALALIYAQFKSSFDPVVLGGFIRMMGVYPPGSVVQLSDERFAMVVSVNASVPQKPSIVVYAPGTHRQEALILDLEHAHDISIRRSLKLSSLPAAAMDFLAPRQRVGYFFERVVDSAMPKVGA